MSTTDDKDHPTPNEPATVHVSKPTPYTFDLGLLTAFDPNPVNLPPKSSNLFESSLASVARDGAQSLINQLLTTCAVTSTLEGVHLTLPPPQTRLPREKSIPVPRPETKWERFAKKKGIKPKTREQRRNLKFNEETGEWERKWGFRGLNKKEDTQWLVEVDPREEERRLRDGTSVRGDGKRERRQRVKKNQKQMLKNLRIAEEVKKRKT